MSDQLFRVRVTYGGGNEYVVRCRRWAASLGQLAVLDFVAPQGHVKQTRAILSVGKKQGKFSLVDSEQRRNLNRDDSINVKPGLHGYRFRYTKLPYGLAHAVAVSDDPSLLLHNTDVELYRKLKGDEYTTPILPEWVPHIREICTGKRLRPIACVGMSAVRLTLTDEELDEIARRGVKSGSLVI